MNKNDIFKTLNNYKKIIENKGYKIYAIVLRGSQNYNLDDEYSDVDATCIVIPTITQLLKRQLLVEKLEFDTGEVLINDIYTFNIHLKKGNPSWIELVYSKYIIGNRLDIFEHYLINPNALYGMMLEKKKNLRHPYPSRIGIINEYGYDPKQLHHIVRLYDLISNSDKFYSYDDNSKDRMIMIKRGYYKNDDVDNIVDEFIIKVEEIKDSKFNNIEINNNIFLEDKIESIVKEYLYQDIISSLEKEDEYLEQFRTFDGKLPKKHSDMFPVLKKWQSEDKDIVYLIHSFLFREV